MACDCGNQEEIDKLREAMFGNGSPQNSVLSRMANIEKALATVRNILWFVACGIMALVIKGAASWVIVGPPAAPSTAMIADTPVVIAEMAVSP